MDKLEYIPGDLVTTNGVPLGTAKDVVYRVVSSDPSKTLKLDDGTVLKGVVRLENIEGAQFGDKGFLLGDCCAWVKDIVPIPLTPEILKKNRWKYWHDDEYMLEDVFLGGDPCDEDNYAVFILYTDYDVWYIEKNGEFVKGDIKYVHQLQHILFGLGINNNMEV